MSRMRQDGARQHPASAEDVAGETMPPGNPLDLSGLCRALEAAGFRLAGGFHPEPADAVPALPDGRPAGTLLLVGNAGSALWRRMQAAPEAGDPHCFEAYTRRVIGELAVRVGGHALFPSDGPPWLPFQRWARRAEPGLKASPLGMLIHPVFGLWHAYRAALIFADRAALEAPRRLSHPCNDCAEKPCLAACPAKALGADGYDVAACRNYLSQHPDCDCLQAGCRVRRACPVGRAFAYDPDHAAHHMRAFAAGGTALPASGRGR
jgi:hypothetical protein